MSFYIPQGHREPDRWRIANNRIYGEYKDGWRTGIDWTRSTPIKSFQLEEEFSLVTTESGSTYKLWKDREVRRD